MILSDRDILKKIASGDIVISSPDNGHEANINASSVDLRLGCFFKKYKHNKKTVLDPHNPKTLIDATTLIELKNDEEPFVVQPGEFVLGVTMETVRLADDLVARVEGRSSLGRLGIIIHSTAGFIDAGFEGTICALSQNARLPACF